jgi:hypothetical protein
MENYIAIQKEGILYGRRDGVNGKEISRCTYLTTDIDEAKSYGDVVLSVEYDPLKNKTMNNYVEGCWQFRVYEPIALSEIIRII